MGMKKDGGEGQTAKRMSTPAYISLLVTATVIVIVGAVFLGKSDSGVINVNSAIQNSNQTDDDASNNVEVVPPAFQNMVNGGLVPQENQPTTPAPAPVVEATTTASTTEEVPEAEGETAPTPDTGTESAS